MILKQMNKPWLLALRTVLSYAMGLTMIGLTLQQYSGHLFSVIEFKEVT